MTRAVILLVVCLGCISSGVEPSGRSSEINGLGIRYLPLNAGRDAMSEHIRAVHQVARDFLQSGETCLRAGCFEEAKFYFTEALRLRWQDADAQAGFEWVQHAQGSLDLPNVESLEGARLAHLRDANSKIRSIERGMTRADVEALLGPGWVNLMSAGWSSGQHAKYWNRELPGYKIVIVYDWVGNHGIGRRSQSIDPVIRAPRLLAEEGNVQRVSIESGCLLYGRKSLMKLLPAAERSNTS